MAKESVKVGENLGRDCSAAVVREERWDMR
jgi:hypothetical protein